MGNEACYGVCGGMQMCNGFVRVESGEWFSLDVVEYIDVWQEGGEWKVFLVLKDGGRALPIGRAYMQKDSVKYVVKKVGL